MTEEQRKHYEEVYSAKGTDVIKVLTKEEKKIVACLDKRDIALFIEDPSSRLCIIRRY